MTSDEGRLAKAAAYGRRLAGETLAEMDNQFAKHRMLMTASDECATIAPVPTPDPTDLLDALREVYQVKATPAPRPRPQLVLVKP